jgi:hypothetical protein
VKILKILKKKPVEHPVNAFMNVTEGMILHIDKSADFGVTILN